MIHDSLRILRVFAGLVAFTPSLISMEPQDSVQAPVVEIEGLKSTYVSCARVDFAVRNVSKQELHTQVAVENLDSGSWTSPSPEIPPDRAIMRIMRAGALWTLPYYRCLPSDSKDTGGIPQRLREEARAFRKTIKEHDEKASSPVLERIRVDAYVRRQGRFELVGKAWSQPFRRIADKTQLPGAITH